MDLKQNFFCCCCFKKSFDCLLGNVELQMLVEMSVSGSDSQKQSSNGNSLLRIYGKQPLHFTEAQKMPEKSGNVLSFLLFLLHFEGVLHTFSYRYL